MCLLFSILAFLPHRRLFNNNNDNNNEGSKSRGGEITPNIFLAHSPAGAESDLNAAAAAPSQTKVTDLNCSDHSTTSRNGARRALVSLNLTRIQDPTLRYTMV